MVFVCATLGEVNEKNAGNWIRHNGGADSTTNISLQLQPGPEDLALWDVLDAATYQSIEAMVGDASTEFWTDSDDNGNGKWAAARATRSDSPAHHRA